MNKPSKIYIVTRGTYSDYHIEALFTDYEQAELYCAVHNEDDVYDYCDIEEWALDEAIFSSPSEIFDKWYGRFDFLGNLTDFGFDCISVKKPNRVKTWKYRGIEHYVNVYVVRGTDEEKAKKILCDYFAQWKSEQLELIR